MGTQIPQTSVDPETGEVVIIVDELGREVLDSTPMEPPLGYNPQPSLAEQIRAMVRSEKLAMEAEAAGLETFEEADDFEVGDDYDPNSPYENEFDPPVSELVKAGEAAVREKAAASSKPKTDPVREDPQPKKTEDSEEETDN